MIAVSFQIDPKTPNQVKKFMKNFPSLTDSAVRDTSSFGKGVIIRNTPRKSGNARRSWGTPRRMQTGIYKLTSDVPPGSNYTPFLEFGTGLFGPMHRKIVAAPGHAFKIPVSRTTVQTKVWITTANTKSGFKTKSKNVKNTTHGFIFRTSIKGMKPAEMVKKSQPVIQADLGRRMDEKITLVFKSGVAQ